MHGYWRNDGRDRAGAARTAGSATGDVGHFDDKGRIVITDRKKDLIVNDKGDNVSPQRIEGMLTLQPEIAQAMVYGDRRPHLVALLVPDPEIASKRRPAAAASARGRPGQCGSVGDREGAPLHPRRRAVHDRERATDAVDEDPPPRHRARSMASGSTRSTSARTSGARPHIRDVNLPHTQLPTCNAVQRCRPPARCRRRQRSLTRRTACVTSA